MADKIRQRPEERKSGSKLTVDDFKNIGSSHFSPTSSEHLLWERSLNIRAADVLAEQHKNLDEAAHTSETAKTDKAFSREKQRREPRTFSHH